VTSNPAGISCGTACSQSVTPGTAITLTATPAAGSSFAGWSGACSGTGTCALTVSAATTVTASFNVAASNLPGDPGTPNVVQGAADASAVTFTVTWTPGTAATSYRYSTSFNDGSGAQQGTVTATSMQLRVPYHTSRTASSAFVCVQSVNAAGSSAGQSCASLLVPAPPAAPLTLSITKSGTGSGTVTSNPAGISCGTACSQSVTPGTAITLTATPAAGSSFAGWSGACSGTGTCAVTINVATTVTASFNAAANLLGDPGTPNVVQGAADASAVTFTVTWAPGTGATSYRYSAGFNDGSGAQQGTVTTTSMQLRVPYHTSGTASSAFVCVQSVNAAGPSAGQACAPLLVPAPPAAPLTLSITKSGTGSGTVTSNPAGISCGATCSQSVTPGTAITLTATPAAGSSFAGWSGACSGTGSCAVTVNAATSVTATFNLVPATLSVARSGAGSGTVTGNPAGIINCGAICSQSVTPGTAIALTATPVAGSSFAGWSGACSGTGTCAVTVNAATSVTATFSLLPMTLSVTKSGTGSGTVTSSPAGIDCGTTCSQPVTPGTAITLTATPAAGSSFASWSGACSGTGICTVTVNAAMSVTATFNLAPVTLSVTKSGTGSGTVVGNPAGINCGATCSQSVTPGTAITLTASPTTGSSFAGWSGACTGTGTCAVTVNAATSVTAAFSTNPNPLTLSITKDGTGSGTVTSAPAGINCGATCSLTMTAGSSLTLTATPVSGSTFMGWSGPCSGTGTCAVTVSSATNVNATFGTGRVDRPFKHNPTPAISSLSPASATAGGTGITLTVSGTGFVSTSVVRWNGSTRATTFVSATQLRAAIITSDLATARSMPVTVVSPKPGGGTSTAVSFTVAAASTAGSFTVATASTPPPAPLRPTVTQLAADASGVAFAVAWAPVSGVASYPYLASFNDGTAVQQGVVTTPSLQLRMPYHVSGVAMGGFVCVASVNAAGQQSATQACNTLWVPARP
jgi:hypothetical protein